MCRFLLFFFFFNDTATTEIYTLSLHDALPIFGVLGDLMLDRYLWGTASRLSPEAAVPVRSEEHTSELQSQFHLVCRLLLEKKKTKDQHQLVTRIKLLGTSSPQSRRLPVLHISF